MNENLDDVSARLRRSLDSTPPELSADIVGGASTRTAPRIVNHGRTLRIAGAATAAIAVVAIGALVIAPTLNRAPLFTAAGGTPSPMAASEDSATTDMRIANWVNYEYVAGEGLSTSGGNGNVYQLKRAGDPQDVLKTVAEAFGVAGDPVKPEYFDPAYPTYVIGSEDGTAESVVLSWSGTGDWWYSNPAAYPPVECVAAPDGGVVVGGDAIAPEVCTTPEATESLAPSEAEARAQAKDLFEASGFDVDAGDIRVTADDWSTTASSSLVVDDVQTAIEWSVSWAPSGLISWAYGHSLDVVNKGSYGTVSAADAVGRLADWRWYGQAGPEFQSGIYTLDSGLARTAESSAADAPAESPAEQPAEEPVPAEEPTDPGTDPGTTDPGTSEPGTEPSTDPSLEPEPNPDPTVLPEPLPTPEEPKTVTVTVEEATETLLLMWDSKGNAWLVPGFAMPHPDGWWNTVISLVDGVIELPEPIEIEPYAVDGRLE